MNLKIDDTNYEQYKNIFEIICKHKAYINPIWSKPEINPINILNDWEKQNKSIARKGLKEGLRDSISSFKHCFSDYELDNLDKNLKENNLPGVRILKSLINDTINKVLKRKAIKNLEEYYIVKEVVIDQKSEIDENDKALLDQYFYDFEFKK
jgi:hypothetical protein